MKHIATKNVLYLFSGYYLETIAGGITFFAAISLVMDLSDNPLHVGLIAMIETMALLLFSALAGIAADRYNRKAVLFLAYTVLGISTTLLYFAESLWSIYLLVFINGTGYSFIGPAKRAIQPTLVKPEHYLDVNSFDAMWRSTLQILRPMLSALTVAMLGKHAAFLIAGVISIVSAVILLGLRIPKLPGAAEQHERAPHRKNGLQELVDGARFVARESSLTYLIIVQLLFTFVISMQGTLTFLHVKENLSQYGETEQIVGYLFSAVGIGGLLGAFFLKHLLKYIGMIPLFLLTLALDGLLVILFALSTNLYLILFIWIFFGVVGSMNTIVTETIIQRTVQAEMRGRVYGIISTFNEPISLLSTGLGTSLAGLIGAKFVFLCAGLSEGIVAVIGRCLPTYGRMNQQLHAAESEEQVAAKL